MRRDEIHRGWKRWPWKDEGSGEVALVGLMPRKTGGGWGSELCFGGTCFGSFAELAPPWVSRAAQITMEGIWERGGETGQTGTYTTDVCSEKYSKIVMQI